jgi:hypothetical protein
MSVQLDIKIYVHETGKTGMWITGYFANVNATAIRRMFDK